MALSSLCINSIRKWEQLQWILIAKDRAPGGLPTHKWNGSKGTPVQQLRSAELTLEVNVVNGREGCFSIGKQYTEWIDEPSFWPQMGTPSTESGATDGNEWGPPWACPPGWVTQYDQDPGIWGDGAVWVQDSHCCLLAASLRNSLAFQHSLFSKCK